ncbi:UNVERIFIED_CONTAM: putative ALA-interacting subunit 2 [Sesamum indicum]
MEEARLYVLESRPIQCRSGRAARKASFFSILDWDWHHLYHTEVCKWGIMVLGLEYHVQLVIYQVQVVIYQFTQQNLPACKPVLSPPWVVEIVYRYDVECVPVLYRSNKLAYIKNNLIPKNCSKSLKIPKHMKAPIYIYYQLDNYYQNHRRYVKSRSDQQLLHGLKHHDISSCAPEDFKHGLPVVPCGLIAWSLFNDTYSFFRGIDEVKVNRKNIAWKSDRDHKFGKQVYPFNFQNGTLSGGAHLDPNIPVSYCILHCGSDILFLLQRFQFPSKCTTN